MPDLSGRSLGRYHVLEPLGEGGMATVYKAYDTRLERDVAVKVIRRGAFPPDQLERILKRFEREAKALGRLTHPNIVPVIDYGEHEGSPYLVMPFLPGGTLKQRLGKPIRWQEAARLLIPVARALDFAHRQGMAHRDVKPANILITADGDPLLTDFGIAKLLEAEEGNTLTGTGVGIGTPEYMAPEQWTGHATARSDIYSLGIVLYECITGRKPYTADTPAAVLIKQTSEPLPRPTEYVPDLPEVVEKVLLKALAKKPEDRFEDMASFASALEKLVQFSQPKEKAKRPTRRPVLETPAPAANTMAAQEQPVTGETVLQEEEKKSPSKKPTAWELPPPLPRENRKTWLPWALGVGGLALLLFCVVVGGLLWGDELVAAVFPTNKPPLGIGSSKIRAADGMLMVYVPEGEFIMGRDTYESLQICDKFYWDVCDRDLFINEEPSHTVYLDGYWIDQTEVTNAMFAQFLNKEGNLLEAGYTWLDAGSEFVVIHRSGTTWNADSGYSDHPVVQVTWYGAQAYCIWAGARLPTEAEWEKAARGTESRTFPWGEGDPLCSLANFRNIEGQCFDGTTSSVGSFPAGASPYGVVDLAGNVWEWVADWYDEDYYASSPDRNPTGPSSGGDRVLRGGSWGNSRYELRSTMRHKYEPTFSSSFFGFRCVQSAP